MEEGEEEYVKGMSGERITAIDMRNVLRFLFHHNRIKGVAYGVLHGEKEHNQVMIRITNQPELEHYLSMLYYVVENIYVYHQNRDVFGAVSDEAKETALHLAAISAKMLDIYDVKPKTLDTNNMD